MDPELSADGEEIKPAELPCSSLSDISFLPVPYTGLRLLLGLMWKLASERSSLMLLTLLLDKLFFESLEASR